jgi:glycosyltransferase involved in cell wall biosynthesis
MRQVDQGIAKDPASTPVRPPVSVEDSVIIGPQPPPIGGIAVYLHRFRKLNPALRFVDEKTMGRRQWLGMLVPRGKHFVYHSPSLRKRLWIAWACRFSGNKYTFVIHGDSLRSQYEGANRAMRKIILAMTRGASSIEVVNAGTLDFLVSSMGVPQDKIRVISPFIPPPPEDEERILASYSGETTEFVSGMRPLIIANAFQLAFHEGTDLYGIDMCIRLIEDLVKGPMPHAGLVCALARVGDEAYFARIKGMIRERNLEGCVHFITGQKEIWPLFKRAQLMVRPTCTDGFGISVAEAIHFGCPAVASDVCNRPSGTVPFKSRDYDDFLRKCKASLGKP